MTDDHKRDGPFVLSALFRRVADPDSSRDALEDFTTEALAGAIRRDPRPMLSVLGAVGVDPASVDGQPLSVFTQRAHVLPKDAIRLDLVLFWPKLALELWVEVKTGAPLSGAGQLDRYLAAQDFMSASDRLSRPPVVLLSEHDLRFSVRHDDGPSSQPRSPHLAWQDIVDAVRASPNPDTLWLELVEFLKEKGMTQDTTFPISAREATSLSDSHRLYRKAVKLVTEVNSRAATQFPKLTWWSQQIAVFVQKQFRDHGRYTLGIWNESKVGLLFGLEVGRSDEATYTVWLQTDPRNVEVRPRAHALAEAAHLRAAGWEIEYEGWKFLEARAHTVNFRTLDDAADWFIDRFAELDQAGMLDLMLQYRQPPENVVEEGSEDDT